MNVNDYSKEDLLKIIGLETDYEPSVYLINTKINDQIIKNLNDVKDAFLLPKLNFHRIPKKVYEK